MGAISSPRQAADFSPPHPDALKNFFPQLEILGLLGRGGMGAVYKARQRGLGRMVALKILPPQISAELNFADRFAREAQALARLNHPNVVTVIDLGQSGPIYYFLMEFVDGVNLRQMLQAGRLAPRDALALILQICEALEYAHDEGVVHRDIKPDNILVNQKGRVKIADFGLAKLLGTAPSGVQLTQSSHVIGTLHYMAPEQMDKPLAVDERADLYSLGVVFYEMLTGELPLGRFELPSQKAAVDAQLDELVLRLLERDPNRRYQQTSEVRAELESIAGVSSRLSPEASRKLSYEYRSKATLFGLPWLHVAIGVNPTTGRKRTAKGIIALGTAPRGVIAFGDVAVGVIACGIFGYGLISISVVSVGVVALGSVAAGLWLAMGGVAIAPLAMGGAVCGYYANGAIAWGSHAVSPAFQDPSAKEFFNPWINQLTQWVFKGSLVLMPIFLALGFVPELMAKAHERRRKRHFERDKTQRKFNPVKSVAKLFLCSLIAMVGAIAGVMLSVVIGLEQPQFPTPMNLWSFAAYTFAAGTILSIVLAELSRWLGTNRWARFAILAWFVYVWLGINATIERCVYTTMGGGTFTMVAMVFACLFVAGAVELLFGGREPEKTFSDDLRQFFASRTTAQWMFRLSAALLVFPMIYFVIGMPVGKMVEGFHYNHAFGLKLPSSMSILLGVEFLRGGFSLLAALPLLVAWRGSWRRFVWTFGLSLFVVWGLYGLLQAFWLPWPMRGIHTVELLLESLAYGWLLAMILLSDVPARKPALAKKLAS